MSAAEAHRYHIEHNGWAGIGYHYVIRFDGTVERGRPRDTVGAHAYGINGVSIGISLAGNWMDKEPYDAQVDSLEKLLADLCDIYGLDQDSIIGHRDVADILGDPSAATDCPGNCLYAKLGEIKSKVKEELA
jgi:Negative regulator of beta-lactamase expression